MFNDKDAFEKMFNEFKPSDIPVPDINPVLEKIKANKYSNTSCQTLKINGDDHVIGCVTDYDWEQIKPWVLSLKASGYRGNIVLLVYNMNAETADRLIQEGVKLWCIGERQPDGSFFYKDRTKFNICVSRFYHLWMFFNNLNNIGRTLVTDVKDVIFQSDPMISLSRFLSYEKPIVVTSESVKYANESWGRNNINEAFGPMITRSMADRVIHNAGVIGGVANILKDLFLNIFLVCRGIPYYTPGGGGPDQAALNILLNMEPWKNSTRFVMSEEGLACQAGTTNDSRKDFQLEDLRPVALKQGKELIIYTTMMRVIPIIHQYDRVPEWRDYFYGKYNVG